MTQALSNQPGMSLNNSAELSFSNVDFGTNNNVKLEQI
jgi:hypothetical protein